MKPGRLGSGSAAGAVLLCLLVGATPLAAQVRPPARDTAAVDTAAADTTAAPQDTVVPPAVLFPAMPVGGAANAADGLWIWDHEALLREAPVSLIELLQRIPGVAAFRAGMFVQPEVASAFGGTAGRTEIELDGYVLDPLTTSTTDLARIPLGQLREVRVERRLGRLRIQLLTEQPTSGRPYSRVEAGVGEPSGELFRGLFLAPHVIVGPLGIGVERFDTDGFGRAPGTNQVRREPANVFNGWAKLGWTGERRGVQLELLRTTLRREPDSPWPVDGVHHDIVLRARNTFAPGLLGELYGGRASLREEPAGDSGEDDDLKRTAVQAGARLAYQSPIGTLAGAFRYRDLAELPRTEAQINARLGLGLVGIAATLTSASWKSGESATAYDVYGRLGPSSLGVFGELTGGRRGAPDYRSGADAVPVLSERTGWRIGAELTLGDRATGSVALIGLEQDPALPFGMPFDTLAPPSATSPARGMEAFGRLVLLPGWFALESWYTNWTSATGWVYLPVRTWRTALELHTVPLKTGNLEILGRLEGTYRGGMLAYAFEPGAEDPGSLPPVALGGFTLFHGYLQIRIIDVRIFLRYEDIVGNEVEILPQRFQRPRMIYGVKWNLWN